MSNVGTKESNVEHENEITKTGYDAVAGTGGAGD